MKGNNTMTFKNITDELHYLLACADKNNRKFILSKLSQETIDKINAFGKSKNFKNDFVKSY